MHPPVSRWIGSGTRRFLEVLFALLVLGAFFAPMLLIGVCVKLTSKGNALFIQSRVGHGGRLFRIYKFRSMTAGRERSAGPGLTKDGDHRVTLLGRYLRMVKLDELPQFINILRGDMSLVGPRPKLPQYAAIPNMPYRPGITGAATIAFRKEEELLRNIDGNQLEDFYTENIKPLKARIDVCYMCRATPGSDLRIIASTLVGCLVPGYAPLVSINGPETRGSLPIPHQRVAPSEHTAFD